MVVGHDDVEPHLTSERDLRVSGDTAVNGDDELGPDVAREPHAAVGQPVSLIESVRDVEVDAATDGLKTPLHQNDGGNAIDVVVAANQDSLAVVDSAAESLERRVDIRKEEGIAELGAIGPEERIGIHPRYNAASGEDGGKGRVYLKLLCERNCMRRDVAVREYPSLPYEHVHSLRMCGCPSDR